VDPRSFRSFLGHLLSLLEVLVTSRLKIGRTTNIVRSQPVTPPGTSSVPE